MKLKTITLSFICILLSLLICSIGLAVSAANAKPLGDVDSDGRVSIKDATLILKHVVSLVTLDQETLRYADTNGDERVNVKDATTIQKHLVGLIELPSAPVETTVPDTFPTGNGIELPDHNWN